MNILTSQIQQYKPEMQETVCQIHNREIVAVDLDNQEKDNFQYLCCNCLVEKMNNNKISTIEQTQDSIQTLKKQKQENKFKVIQVKLDHFKFILNQLMEFKCEIENTLEKIYSQIKAQIFAIQKEKQDLLDNFQIQYNFQEDVKSLFEFLSSDTQKKELELESQFIDEIFKQFELLFNSAAYFQTIDAFKDAKQKINEIHVNNKIELMSLQNTNHYKTPSLKKLCSTHNKEIIMIDIDSKNKNIEERFACVDCISDHPCCQYRTVEKINQQLNLAKKEQDRQFSDLKIQKYEKQEKLNQQIAIMRKNYNQQLNEISEKLMTEFFPTTGKTIEINKFKQISIQQLSIDELLSIINQLILKEKENLVQDSKIEYLKSKDNLFQKEIQGRLENLKQHDQLDIQQTINILLDIQNGNQVEGIVQQQQKFQEGSKTNQEYLIFKQDLDELLDSSKYIYCQKSLLNESIQKYQEHLTKIKTFVSKAGQVQGNLLIKNLQKQVNDYKNKFENDFKQLMKYCEIEKHEKNFQALHIEYEKLQLESINSFKKLENQYLESIENEYKSKFENQNTIIKKLEDLVKNTESKLKNQLEEEELLKGKLIEQKNNNAESKLKFNQEQMEYQNEIQSLNEKINQIQKELNFRLSLTILDIKPKLLKNEFWTRLFFAIQEKSKKAIKESQLIYQGSRDGLNNTKFWNQCNGKCNLLMIFYSQSGHIFGGYSPCQWQQNLNAPVQDDTLSSFLFTQTHDQIYPLKQCAQSKAIYCQSGWGPIFGGGHDIKIAGDFKEGYSYLGSSYQWDQFQNKYTDHLFGQDKPNIADCEIYELKII